MSISEKLREAYRESGLTQQQLAAATGVSQRAISDFLRGRKVYSDTLDAIADVVGADLRVPKSFRKNIRKCIVVD